MEWKFCTSHYVPQIQDLSFRFGMHRIMSYGEMVSCCHQSAGDREDPEFLLLLPPSHADPHTLQSLLWASRKQTLNSVTGLSLQILCPQTIKSTPNLSFQHSSWLQSSAFCPPFSLPTHGCVFATKDCATLLCLNHSNKLG